MELQTRNIESECTIAEGKDPFRWEQGGRMTDGKKWDWETGQKKDPHESVAGSVWMG